MMFLDTPLSCTPPVSGVYCNAPTFCVYYVLCLLRLFEDYSVYSASGPAVCEATSFHNGGRNQLGRTFARLPLVVLSLRPSDIDWRVRIDRRNSIMCFSFGEVV